MTAPRLVLMGGVDSVETLVVRCEVSAEGGQLTSTQGGGSIY